MLKIKQFLIVLTIILLVNPISFAQIIWAEGLVVDESFIEIENSEDLADIKDDLTENYLLTKDIDLKDAEWEPIDEGEFTGTLSGDDFTIQNMPTQYSEDENLGLFAEVKYQDNVDVEIEFAAEEIEEPEFEEDASDKKSEEVEQQEENAEKEDEIVEKSFIEIENSNELINIKEDLTGDYVLTQDIDLKDTEWEAIQGEFTGTLTGDGFIIKNMPAKYLKRGNLSLFTEVKYEDNIKIEIEFMEEEIKESELEEEIVEEEIEEPKAEEKTEEPQNEEKSVEEKTEEPQTNEKARNLMAPMAGSTMNVDDYKTFREALEDITVTTINLKEDIYRERASAGSFPRIIIPPRNVIVNGNGKEIHQSSKRKQSMMQLHQDGGEGHITFKNVIMTAKGDDVPLIYGRTGGLGIIQKDVPNWTITFENVSSREINTGAKSGLSGAKKAKVIFKSTGDGKTNYSTADDADYIIKDAKSVVIESGIVEMSTKGSFFETDIRGATLEVQKEATLDVKARGTSDKSAIDLSNNDSDENKISKILVEGTFIIKSDRKINAAAKGLISLSGVGSEFIVENNGVLDFNHNEGSIIHFNGKNSEFGIMKDSRAKLIADNGLVLRMSNGGNVKAQEAASFIAHGKTAPAPATGIIDIRGGDQDNVFEITDLAYYDFKNNQTDGFIFRTNANAKFKSTRMNVAVWKNGPTVNLDGLPNNYWKNATYSFKGVNFTSKNDWESSPETLGSIKSLDTYARMSSHEDTIGKLKISSFPKDLIFDVKVESQEKDYLVDTTQLGAPLEISDDRLVKNDWTLNARMDSELTANVNNKDYVLSDALFYIDDGNEVFLDGSSQIVKTHSYIDPSPGEVKTNLSQDWTEEGNNNGLFIRIKPGVINAEYTGRVEWILIDAS